MRILNILKYLLTLVSLILIMSSSSKRPPSPDDPNDSISKQARGDAKLPPSNETCTCRKCTDVFSTQNDTYCQPVNHEDCNFCAKCFMGELSGRGCQSRPCRSPGPFERTINLFTVNTTASRQSWACKGLVGALLCIIFALFIVFYGASCVLWPQRLFWGLTWKPAHEFPWWLRNAKKVWFHLLNI